MPGGYRPGAGRKKGGRNKATIEREAIAALQAAAHKVSKATLTAPEVMLLGKDVMRHAANRFYALAVFFDPQGANADEARFKDYMRLAADAASKLAGYESPRFSSVEVNRRMDLSKLTHDQLQQLGQLVGLAALPADPGGSAERDTETAH